MAEIPMRLEEDGTWVPMLTDEVLRAQKSEKLVNAVTGEEIASREVENERPFIVTIYLPFGIVREFTVTEFEVDYDNRDRMTGVSWSQKSLIPGEDTLQYVQWGEVLMISTRSIEGP
jgi:hypothetical protein